MDNSDGELMTYWAVGCDFLLNNLFSQITTTSQDCLRLCRQASQCSHFTWNKVSTTCWIKKGPVEKKDAYFASDSGICGIVAPRVFSPGNPSA